MRFIYDKDYLYLVEIKAISFVFSVILNLWISASCLEMKLFGIKDTWFRLLVVPLFGMILPYLTSLHTPCSSYNYLYNFPQLYFAPAAIIVFEVNRFLVVIIRESFKLDYLNINRILIQTSVQFLSSFLLFVVFLYAWYHFILLADCSKNFSCAFFA